MINRKKIMGAILSGTLAAALLTGCAGMNIKNENASAQSSTAAESSAQTDANEAESSASQSSQAGGASQSGSGAVNAVQNGESSADSVQTSVSSVTGGALNGAELFTERDLVQTADLDGAETFSLSDGQTVTIDEEGVYVFSGSARNYTIVVDAADDAKVQIVLDGVDISNDSFPAIYVKNADKVFVTTTESGNSLAVTGEFTEDGETNTDAVIFSRDDLVLNGLGTLTIESTENGISGKDDVKITGGTISVTCTEDGIEANDSIAVAGGTINISTPEDGLHAENDDDSSKGYIYIGGGSLNIQAGDDAVHATTILQVDGGSISIVAAEGLEGTWIQVNGGDISIEASDDGINAGKKSDAFTVMAEFNGGTVTINMGGGDTDGIDSNGDLILNGGTITINANSPFDYDGKLEKNGGTLIINGQETDTVSNQFGGGMGGGQGGMPGGGMDGSQNGMPGSGQGMPGEGRGDNGSGWSGGRPGGFGGRGSSGTSSSGSSDDSGSTENIFGSQGSGVGV